MTFDKPILTVDVVALRLTASGIDVALTTRKEQPFKGMRALPGGYVHTDKDMSTDDSALRVLRDKLGFRPSHIEQVCTVAGPKRDPRGWSASVVYLALLSPEAAHTLEASNTPGAVHWTSVTTTPQDWAFDHAHLVGAGVDRLKSKAKYSTIVAHLMPPEFSMSDLHDAYQRVLEKKIDPANFRRKMLDLGGLEDVGIDHQATTRGRPRASYRLADHERLALFERSLA